MKKELTKRSKNNKITKEEELKIIRLIMEKEEREIPEVDIGDFATDIMLFYAASISLARIVPDVRDGLKPVVRRILYAMKTLGLENKKGKSPKSVKCARIVGEVLGKFHP